MDVETRHNLLIEGEPEDTEALEPIIQDIIKLISAVEDQGPATKAPIVNECRNELTEVMQEENEERIGSPGDVLDILATYDIIEKENERFRTKSNN